MRFLLDTHVLLWWLAGGQKIAKAARDAISSPDSIVLVSSATMWEISIKRALGKLRVPEDFLRHVDRDFQQLTITHEHAWRAGALPKHHDDPFDRMLIAQSIVEQATIVTRDARFQDYDVLLLDV